MSVETSAEISYTRNDSYDYFQVISEQSIHADLSVEKDLCELIPV